MRSGLRSAGVDAVWHNIWDDAEAARFVRSVAGGNETVPTVSIGDDVLVAPRPRQVIDRLVETDPDLVPDPRRWPPLRVAQWTVVSLLVSVAYIVGRTGNDGLALFLDATTIAAYLAFRHLRSRARSPRPVAPDGRS
jgi:hypothetical protein